MRLSPWEPPRFLWAAVEGVSGVMLTPDRPRVAPLVPPTWKWLALKRLPYHGKELAFFAVCTESLQRLSATADIDSDVGTEVYDEDVSQDVRVLSEDAAVVALRRADVISILVGNVASRTTTVAVDISQLLDNHATYDARL